MAWLTVREAAETMRISEGAVRKRMQRNSLQYNKLPDGRVYVYLPSLSSKQDGMGEKNAGVKGAADTGQSKHRSWLEYVAAGSGALALVVGLTYVLGLLTLWIPIWRNYTGEASTAWYAASLVPQSAVAGRGFGQLVGIPVLVVVVLAITIALAVFLNRWDMGDIPITFCVIGSSLWDVKETYNWSLPAFLAALVLCVALLHFLIRRYRRLVVDSVTRPIKNHFKDDPEAAEDLRNLIKEFKDEVPEIRWYWVVWPLLALAFVHTAWDILALSDPALPTVEITGVKDKTGALLAHTDGFWYVFDVAGENKGELTALRDDQVEAVRFTLEDKPAEGNLQWLIPE